MCLVIFPTLSQLFPITIFLTLFPLSLSSNFHSFSMCGLAWVGVNAIWMHCLHFSFSADRHRVFFFSSSRTLTELLKQPGEAGAVDGTGVHHPIGTNGISARALRSNNGQSSLHYCMSVLYELNWCEQKEVLQLVRRWDRSIKVQLTENWICLLYTLKVMILQHHH